MVQNYSCYTQDLRYLRKRRTFPAKNYFVSRSASSTMAAFQYILEPNDVPFFVAKQWCVLCESAFRGGGNYRYSNLRPKNRKEQNRSPKALSYLELSVRYRGAARGAGQMTHCQQFNKIIHLKWGGAQKQAQKKIGPAQECEQKEEERMAPGSERITWQLTASV